MSTKALDSHLDTLKNLGDTIQDTTLRNSNISILVFIETDGLVELPSIDEIDEYFSHKNFLFTQNFHLKK